MSLIEVKGLSISFLQYAGLLKRRVVDVVQDVSFTLEDHEVLVVFGASGCGKSLLAHALLGLLPENAMVQGEILYSGTMRDIDSVRGVEVGFIPQAITSLNPLLKIQDQVFLDGKKRDDVERRLREGLSLFGLSEDVLEMYPHELSGGMARRVLVVLSSLNGCRVLVADEPTPGMDEVCLEQFVRFVNKQREIGSCLLISHDMKTSLKVADRIAIFKDGQIVEIVRRDDFVNRNGLKEAYTQKLADMVLDGFVC